MSDLTQATLEWANEIRVANGRPKMRSMPRGRYGHLECPLAVALGAYVGKKKLRIVWDGNAVVREMPQVVQEFVRAFNNGELPELERPGAPLKPSWRKQKR